MIYAIMSYHNRLAGGKEAQGEEKVASSWGKKQLASLKVTAKAPENWWLKDEVLFGMA